MVGADITADIPRDVADAYRKRESLWCGRCGASQRERRLATALLTFYGAGAHALADGVRAMDGLDILELNRFNAGHAYLNQLARTFYVEYPEEDMQAMTFPDESFDLVVTSETLEHVEDPVAAIRESFRVLRPGGRHVFTVPLRPDLATTRPRTGLRDVHHGRPPGPWRLLRKPTDDMLVRTDFGRDFGTLIETAGFELTTQGAGVDTVFAARRPESLS